MVKNWQESSVVYGTEDILTSLCNSVTRVLTVATQCPINYSGMVQRITKICLKPYGLVALNGLARICI